eukprot:g22756.t1
MCNEADLNVKENLGGNDHIMTEFTLQSERAKLESDVMVLQLCKDNYKDMTEELARVDWKGSLAGKMVEQQWQEFLGVFWKAQQKFIPRKKKHIKGSMRQPGVREVPEDWKIVNVTPKKGGKQKTGNYRPVSLTSVE